MAIKYKLFTCLVLTCSVAMVTSGLKAYSDVSGIESSEYAVILLFRQKYFLPLLYPEI